MTGVGWGLKRAFEALKSTSVVAAVVLATTYGDEG